jgi:hypothetical protein
MVDGEERREAANEDRFSVFPGGKISRRDYAAIDENHRRGTASA